jgi:hypothetical protein
MKAILTKLVKMIIASSSHGFLKSSIITFMYNLDLITFIIEFKLLKGYLKNGFVFSKTSRDAS